MPDTPTPFVVIPYFSGDDGTRPVDPQKATWWLCSSILINDVPYSGPLDRSNPLKLSVRVANWGHYPATPLLVRLFWSPPASGPAGVQLHPVGQTIFPVLNAGEEGVIPVIERWTPASDMPEHSCLFAEAGVPAAPPVPAGSPPPPPADPANGSFDPVNDRHYGQQNIIFLHAQVGTESTANFSVGNPMPARRRVEVRASVLQGSALARVAGALRVEPADAEPAMRVALLPPQGASSGANPQSFSVEIGPNGYESVGVRLSVPPNVPSRRLFAVEILQSHVVSDKQVVVGAQGIVVITV